MIGFGHMVAPWGLGMVFGPLLWVGILALLVWAVAGLVPRRDTRGDPALEALKVRYARGEIGREEFQQLKKDLV